MGKATKCECCGFASYNGRVCKGCRKYWYGSDTEQCIAAAALARRCHKATREQMDAILAELCDVIVYDWPCVDMAPLVHQIPAAPIGETGKADS